MALRSILTRRPGPYVGPPGPQGPQGPQGPPGKDAVVRLVDWGCASLIRGDTFIAFRVPYATAASYAFVGFPCAPGLSVHVRKNEAQGVTVRSDKAGSLYWMAWGT